MCYVVRWRIAGVGGWDATQLGVLSQEMACAIGECKVCVRVKNLVNTPYSNYCVLRYVSWKKVSRKVWLKRQELIRGDKKMQVGKVPFLRV